MTRGSTVLWSKRAESLAGRWAAAMEAVAEIRVTAPVAVHAAPVSVNFKGFREQLFPGQTAKCHDSRK